MSGFLEKPVGCFELMKCEGIHGNKLITYLRYVIGDSPFLQDLMVQSFEDNRYSITEMAIEETYGFGVLNEGLAIGVAKNVKIRPNEFTLPARTVVDISGANSLFEEKDSVADFGSSPLDVNAR